MSMRTSDLAAEAAAVLDEAYGITLGNVPMPGEWAARGRCRRAQSIFFPGRGDDTEPAKEICRRCPVVAKCLEYALEAPPALQGIWAGTTARERRQLKRQHEEMPLILVPDEPSKPRATRAYNGVLQRTLAQLVEHPGRWARVGHYAGRQSAQSMASLLRNGLRSVPSGRWQFEGRLSDAGGSDLYALYEGAEEAAG